MTSLRILKATETDTSLILKLIQELAEYEKLLNEVVANEKTLHQSLFKEPNAPEVLLAYENEKVVGFVLFFHNFSTFLGKKGIYIEDLYVRESFRGKGYGQQLLKAVCQIAKIRNCCRVEWWVLDWNKKAIDFYQKIGARSMDEWTVFRLSSSGIDSILEKDSH